MAVSRNRLDENKGTFGPFVAGQKDEQKKVAYMGIVSLLYKKRGLPCENAGSLFCP
jgi:hypothetical protein